jgi:hypothetical protein
LDLRGTRYKESGEDYKQEKLYDLYSSPSYSGDQIKKNEMGRACSHHEVKEMCIQNSGGETRGKETTRKIQTVDGRIILKWIFKKWDMDWIDLPQGRDRWQTVVNAIMNPRIPLSYRGFLTSGGSVSF